MERTKRMLIVMLTSFGIFALLTFLTFSSYGQNALKPLTNYMTTTQDNLITPNEILKETLEGAWEAFYNGRKTYITFNEDNSVIMRLGVRSNGSANTNEANTNYDQMYYEIDASVSPYKLVIYNNEKEIKGLFRIVNDDQIITCHNFNSDYQPKEIDSDYTVLTLYRVKKEDR
ncbi:hypothetical protein WAF17_17410 [Bernardetia sp. ABR2-2B]|uniref:hypothetical protein n=1 Tax=Bernardetia sp. ABR2-2B TaxID=3127472 RepID=UPI0030D5D70F